LSENCNNLINGDKKRTRCMCWSEYYSYAASLRILSVRLCPSVRLSVRAGS